MAPVMVVLAALAVLQCAFASGVDAELQKKHHHHKHGHHKHRATSVTVASANASSLTTSASLASAAEGLNATSGAKSARAALQFGSDHVLTKAAAAQNDAVGMERITHIHAKVSTTEATAKLVKGSLEVNGPLPVDFSERFAQATGRAVGCDPSEVRVLSSSPIDGQPGVVGVTFEAPSKVVQDIEEQAADPASKLANSPLHHFLVSDASEAAISGPVGELPTSQREAVVDFGDASDGTTVVQTKGIDIDTEMPYGELEPFGREDTAQELTEQSVKESDEMVDQLERAEVAEEKRSVFRALTRLRGAAITSFDGIARSQTGSIDEYNKVHQWRMAHPLHHLADEESDISKWAFPDNADF